MIPVGALYREHPGAEWSDVEIVGRHPSGKLVLREVGRFFPGVRLADVEQVRVPVVCLHGAALIEPEAA